MLRTRRTPGITFETVVPAAPDPLPRMDVAAFVGFAARGPVGIPVAIDSVVRFHDVFGEDLSLAWDRQRGEMVRAQLAPAVRAFFRDGGRRCWVVRVAQGATTSRVSIPGLLRVARSGTSPDREFGAATLAARSPGSWADRLAVNATALHRAVPATAITSPPGDYRLELHGAAPGELVMLRIANTTLVGFADAVAIANGVGVRYADEHWFEELPVDQIVPPKAAPPVHPVIGPPTRVEVLSESVAPIPLAPIGWDRTGTKLTLDVVPNGESATVSAGAWLRVHAPGATSLPGGEAELLLRVDDVHTRSPDPVASLPTTGDRRTLVMGGQWRVLDASETPSATMPVRTTVVELELWVRQPRHHDRRLVVGLTGGHPRFMDHLPTDEELFARDERLRPFPGEEIWREVGDPRFPLAAAHRASSERPHRYLPLGVGAIPAPELDRHMVLTPAAASSGAPATRSPRRDTPLERDGLAEYSSRLFLDEFLTHAGRMERRADELLDAAFELAHHVRPPRRPDGLHALLDVAEASLIAVPDATHTGWFFAERTSSTIDGPWFEPVEPAPGHRDVVRLRWSAVPDATAYELEESTDPDFPEGQTRTTRTGTTDHESLTGSDCPTLVHFRVRALLRGRSSPWSGTVVVPMTRGAFAACAPKLLTAPVLTPGGSPGSGLLTFEWTDAGPHPSSGYRLEAAGDPSFALARTAFLGTVRRAQLWHDPNGALFFRVRAEDAERRGPWSNTVATTEAPVTAWEYAQAPGTGSAMAAAASDEANVVLGVHRALLRLCVARADALAVLALPRHYREAAAVAHIEALRRVPEFGREDEEQRALSFAALYHPWLVVRDVAAAGPAPALRAITPDGSACGVIAARTLAGGAWMAPANQLLRGVVDVDPVFDDAAAARAFAAQVDLVRSVPRGFLTLSADTLSANALVRSINVRRLLILLRRLALREGTRAVFATNDSRLRRRVQRQFEEILGELHQRGAFAGAQRDEAFEVITDEGDALERSAERGRVLVELRVAPAEPLVFLTVRLVQSGDRLRAVEV